MSEELNADKSKSTSLAEAHLKKDNPPPKPSNHKVEEKVRIHPILKERRVEKLDPSSTCQSRRKNS